MMVSYIDNHRDRFGVEPICKELPIAPSTYYDHKVRQRDPEGRYERAKRDERLMPEIQRVWEENFRVYGARELTVTLRWEHKCLVVNHRSLREGPCESVYLPELGFLFVDRVYRSRFGSPAPLDGHHQSLHL